MNIDPKDYTFCANDRYTLTHALRIAMRAETARLNRLSLLSLNRDKCEDDLAAMEDMLERLS